MKIKISDFIYDEKILNKIKIANEIVSINQKISTFSTYDINNYTNIEHVLNADFSPIYKGIYMLPDLEQEKYKEKLKGLIIFIYQALYSWIKDVHIEIKKANETIQNIPYDTHDLENHIVTQMNTLYYLYESVDVKYYNDSINDATKKIISIYKELKKRLNLSDIKQVSNFLLTFIKKLRNLCVDIVNNIELDI